MENVEDIIVESWHELLAREPYLAWRMLQMRKMLEHRRINAMELGAEMNRSSEFVRKNLRPSGVRFTEGWVPNTNTPEAVLQNLDDMDDAVSRITERRGGIFKSCGCTTLAVEVLKFELSSSHSGKEWEA